MRREYEKDIFLAQCLNQPISNKLKVKSFTIQHTQPSSFSLFEVLL